MLALTGRPLLIMVAFLAVILPLTLLVLWSRASWRRQRAEQEATAEPSPEPDAESSQGTARSEAGPGAGLLSTVRAALRGRRPGRQARRSQRLSRPRFALHTAGRVLLLVASHVVVLLLVGLLINNSPENRFYASWKDLWTEFTADKPVDTVVDPSAGMDLTKLNTGTGKVEKMVIQGREVLVWLPQHYHDPQAASTRYPVVMFMPGQPSSPTTVYNQYSFGQTASTAIAEGKIPPFIGVFPPIMINPPIDTECTDVPGGPQAETWLAQQVPQAVAQHYRTQQVGRAWSALGWSTGGFCASKLALKHPTTFGSGVSFGGHLIPWGKKEDALQRLFKGNAELMTLNTPMEIYKAQGTRGAKLLLIAGEQDPSTWRQVKPLQQLAVGDPSVKVISFPEGAHHYKNYRVYLPAALQWVGSSAFQP